jgi:hypothetical protein
MNARKEEQAAQRAPMRNSEKSNFQSRDFSTVIKVDTHVHLAGGATGMSIFFYYNSQPDLIYY